MTFTQKLTKAWHAAWASSLTDLFYYLLFAATPRRHSARYLARALGRRVAVKTLSVGLLGRDREARISRFQREVKALSQLDHAGILHIYDADEADDSVIGWVLYYAMKLVEGETLSERLIRGGAMERAAACAGVQKCAAARGTAHGRGIVHRDV